MIGLCALVMARHLGNIRRLLANREHDAHELTTTTN